MGRSQLVKYGAEITAYDLQTQGRAAETGNMSMLFTVSFIIYGFLIKP